MEKLIVSPSYKYQNGAKKTLDELSEKQKKIVIGYATSGRIYEGDFLEELSDVKYLRFLESLASKLRISKEDQGKTVHDLELAIGKRVREMYTVEDVKTGKTMAAKKQSKNKKIVSTSSVTRRPGYMYYVDAKGNVVETKMAWNKDKK